MCIRALLSGAALVLALAAGAVAQQVVVQAVKLRDGATHHGQVTESGDSLTIQLASGGRLTIPKSLVEKIDTVRGQVTKGEFRETDPNQTRLFFAPTARTLSRGSGYFSVYEIILPFLGFGITDRITLAGGVLPIFAEDMPLVGYLAPKVQLLAGKDAQAAIGVLAFFTTETAESAGILYGVASFGQTSDRSMSLGAGYGYAGSEMAHTPVLMIGGETRTGRRTKLITENWFFPGEGAIISFGPRFLGQRISGDLGLALPLFGESTVVFPLVNFVVNW